MKAGWGLVVVLAEVAVVGACARPASVTPARLGARAEPDIRVGLEIGVPEVRVGGRGLIVGFSHGTVVVRGPARLVPDGRALRLASGLSNERFERLTFVSRTPGRFVTVNGRPFRGAVEIYNRGGGLTVVNELGLEEYLVGVVTAELGPRTERERAAVEAQAIVARTYALENMGKFRSDGYDLRATVSDQAYAGASVESDIARAAVEKTRGRVVTYRGDLIASFFHSTCGGTTASPEEAFRMGRPRPYLRPVSDRRPGGGDYCDISPRYRWTVAWGGAAMRDIFRRTIPRALGIEQQGIDQVHDVKVRRRGPSGRVVEARIRVGSGEIPVFAPDVRAVFAKPEGGALGSTLFDITIERDGGRIRRVIATGWGFGHGVGMCQWGAIGRARAGQDAQAIVTTYFPGTRIERWY